MKAKEFFDKIWDKFALVWCVNKACAVTILKDDELNDYLIQSNKNDTLAIIDFDSENIKCKDGRVIIPDETDEGLELIFYRMGPELILSIVEDKIDCKEQPELTFTEQALLDTTYDLTKHTLYMKVGCEGKDLDELWNEILRVREKDEAIKNGTYKE